MDFNRKELSIPGAYTITPSVHYEYRGEIATLSDRRMHLETFVCDKISKSFKNVIRGFHGDFRTGKLLSCLSGSMMLAIADIRPDQATYGKSLTFILNDQNRAQVYIPPGTINAHLCLSDSCILWYKLTAEYQGPDEQLTVRYDDPFFAVHWPIDNPILSERDAKAPDWSCMPFRRVVAVSGYFNPLHSGHLNLFKAARTFGTELLVIVNNDQQVALKGSQPFMAEQERLEIVRSCKWVDRAVLSVDIDRSVNLTLLKERPDVFANGGDVLICVEEKTCAASGIKVVYGVGGDKTQSSSKLLNKARG